VSKFKEQVQLLKNYWNQRVSWGSQASLQTTYWFLWGYWNA